ALFAQYPVLAPKPRQFFPLTAGQSVAALSRIELRLSDPLPNALDRRFELTRQLLQRPPRARQFDHPPPILGRVWWMCFRHRSPPCLPAKHTPRNRVNSTSWPAGCMAGQGRPLRDQLFFLRAAILALRAATPAAPSSFRPSLK